MYNGWVSQLHADTYCLVSKRSSPQGVCETMPVPETAGRELNVLTMLVQRSRGPTSTSIPGIYAIDITPGYLTESWVEVRPVIMLAVCVVRFPPHEALAQSSPFSTPYYCITSATHGGNKMNDFDLAMYTDSTPTAWEDIRPT